MKVNRHSKKIVLGISGASGALYAKRLIEELKCCGGVEVEIVASENALQIGRDEAGIDYRQCGFPFFESRNFSAPFASGSAVIDYQALAIVPCSMGMIGRIAHGVSDDLLSRAADVFLKERRRLIVVPRETPFSLVHLENMRLLTLAGTIVLPASPSFYSKPKTIEEAVDTVVARILDHLGIENRLRQRWGSNE